VKDHRTGVETGNVDSVLDDYRSYNRSKRSGLKTSK
jgi:hypothetical protein